MPTSQWDTPFTYAKGNKEFPEDVGKVNDFVFHVDVPTGPPTPMDSPIDGLKVKEKAATASDDLSSAPNKAEWDTPFKEAYSKGSDVKHN